MLVIKTITVTFKIRPVLAPVYIEEQMIGTRTCQQGKIKCSLKQEAKGLSRPRLVYRALLRCTKVKIYQCV